MRLKTEIVAREVARLEEMAAEMENEARFGDTGQLTNCSGEYLSPTKQRAMAAACREQAAIYREMIAAMRGLLIAKAA
jgi:hypothetical protein